MKKDEQIHQKCIYALLKHINEKKERKKKQRKMP